MSDQRDTIHIKVLFFATIKEKAGVKETELRLPVSTKIGDLKKILAERYPAIAQSLSTVIVAVNREYAFDKDHIPDKAEIAIFPPVSGGAEIGEDHPTIICISEDVIDIDNLINGITLPTTGAACIFSGFVREITTRGEAHETRYLEYEAYQEMAELKMRQVVDEIRMQWPLIIGIAIVQRVGILNPRTPTVLIACSAAHRDTGIFEAARYGIDRLKEIVPIWKKEIGSRGEIWVEGNYYPKPGE